MASAPQVTVLETHSSSKVSGGMRRPYKSVIRDTQYMTFPSCQDDEATLHNAAEA